jgi:GxxExxY protein
MSSHDRTRVNEISKIIIEAALSVHSEFGPGLMESVYETALAYELAQRGLSVQRQWPIPVVVRGTKLDDGFRCDLLVESCIIVELKSVETLAPVFFKILLTYLRLSDRRLGLLINFSEDHLKDGIHRVVNNF